MSKGFAFELARVAVILAKPEVNLGFCHAGCILVYVCDSTFLKFEKALPLTRDDRVNVSCGAFQNDVPSKLTFSPMTGRNCVSSTPPLNVAFCSACRVVLLITEDRIVCCAR